MEYFSWCHDIWQNDSWLNDCWLNDSWLNKTFDTTTVGTTTVGTTTVVSVRQLSQFHLSQYDSWLNSICPNKTYVSIPFVPILQLTQIPLSKYDSCCSCDMSFLCSVKPWANTALVMWGTSRVSHVWRWSEERLLGESKIWDLLYFQLLLSNF